MEKVAVTVQKISGESMEMCANLEDSVQSLQDEIAKQLNVPVMCQKLWIDNASPTLVEKLVPHLSHQLERAIEQVDKRSIQEVKALAKPPEAVKKMTSMVYHLLNSSSKPRMPEWKMCVKMMANPSHFLDQLKQFPREVKDLQSQSVEAVKAIIKEMGEGYARWTFQRCSLLTAYLFDWLQLALKIYEAVHFPGDVKALQLDGELAVFAYVDTSLPKEAETPPTLQVTLLVDYDAVFAAFKTARNLEPALEALKVIGAKCEDRSVPYLARQVYSSHPGRVLELVKAIWPSPSDRLAEMFASHFGNFYHNPFQGAVEVLEYLGPKEPRALKCIITGLNCNKLQVGGRYAPRRKVKRVKEDVENDADDLERPFRLFRQGCLDIFKHAEPHCDPKMVIDAVLQAILELEAHACDNARDALQDEILQALAIVSQRDYDHAMSAVVGVLANSRGGADESTVRAALAAAAFAKREDERLLEAFSACHGDDVPLRTLLTLAECFLEVSSSRSPFVSSIMARLERGLVGSDQERAMDLLPKLVPQDDEQVITLLVKTLNRSPWIIAKGEASALKCAATCLDRVASDKSTYQGAYDIMLDALIHSYCWNFRDSQNLREILVDTAKNLGGLQDKQLGDIAMAFNCSISCSRAESQKLFKEIAKSPEAKPSMVLFNVLDENLSVYSSCLAIDALSHTTPRNDVEVTEKLLSLLGRPDCQVKTAALESLMSFSTDASIKDRVLKCMNDSDSFVRRSALTLLMHCKLLDTSDVELLERCLVDASDVAVLALQSLSQITLSNELVTKIFEVMIYHADPMCRREAANTIAEASRGPSGPVLVEALRRASDSSNMLWTETNELVIEARKEALVALGMPAFSYT